MHFLSCSISNIRHLKLPVYPCLYSVVVYPRLILLQQARSLNDFAMKGVEVAKTVKKEATTDNKGSR